jgi:hypothetical protein
MSRRFLLFIRELRVSLFNFSERACFELIDQVVSFDDVELNGDLDVVALRKQMEETTRASTARSAA